MSEFEIFDECGYLRLFKKDGTEGSAYKLTLNEKCSIGTDIRATIRLKSISTEQPIHCIVNTDSNGVVTLINKDINKPIKVNDKYLPGLRYLLPGDCFEVLGKKIRYDNSSMTTQQIEWRMLKNTKLATEIRPKQRQSFASTTRKSVVKSIKTNLDASHSRRFRHNNEEVPSFPDRIIRTPDARKYSYEPRADSVPQYKRSSSIIKKSRISRFDKSRKSIRSLRRTNEKLDYHSSTPTKSTNKRSSHGSSLGRSQFERVNTDLSVTSEVTGSDSEEVLEESAISKENSPEVELQKTHDQSRKKSSLDVWYSEEEKCCLTAVGHSSKDEHSQVQLSSPDSLSTNSNNSNVFVASKDKATNSGDFMHRKVDLQSKMETYRLLNATPKLNLSGIKPMIDTNRKASIIRSLPVRQNIQENLQKCSNASFDENSDDDESHSTDLEPNMTDVSINLSLTSEEKYSSADEEYDFPSSSTTSLIHNLRENIPKEKRLFKALTNNGRSSSQFTNRENVPKYSNSAFGDKYDRKNQSSRCHIEDTDDTDDLIEKENWLESIISTVTLSPKPNMSRIKPLTEVKEKRKLSIRRSLRKLKYLDEGPTYSSLTFGEKPKKGFSSDLLSRLTSEDTDDLGDKEHGTQSEMNKSSTITVDTKPNVPQIKSQTELTKKRKRSTRRSLRIPQYVNKRPSSDLTTCSSFMFGENLQSNESCNTQILDRNNDSDNGANEANLQSIQPQQDLFSDQSSRFISDDTDDLEDRYSSQSNMDKSCTLPLSPKPNVSKNTSQTEPVKKRKQSIRRSLQIPQYVEDSVKTNSCWQSNIKMEDNLGSTQKRLKRGLFSDKSTMFTSEGTDDLEDYGYGSPSYVNKSCTLTMSPKRNISQTKSQTEVIKRRKRNSRRSLGIPQALDEHLPANSSFTFLSNSPNSNNMKKEDMKNDSRNDAKLQCTLKSPTVRMVSLDMILHDEKNEQNLNNEVDNFFGAKKLMSTPKAMKDPKNELTDFRGVRKLMSTPNEMRSPKNELTDFRGVRKLMSMPKEMKGPKNELTDLRGVRKLMSTPKELRSPKNELTDLRGVRKLMSTPRELKSPKNELTDLRGVRKLMSTPMKIRSPKNELTDLHGVRKLMSTPKHVSSPKSDLSSFPGVKKLMSTPKLQKSPKNDLSDFAGVKRLMSIPKFQKSPKNDLSELDCVKELFSTPKLQKNPKNELTTFPGVKKLMSTPKKTSNLEEKSTKDRKTPVIGKKSKNDMSNSDNSDTVQFENANKNTAELAKKSPAAIDTEKLHLSPPNLSVIVARDTNDNQTGEIHNIFDSLLVNKPLRTYKGKSTSPLKIKSNKSLVDFEAYVPSDTEKWVQKHYKISTTKNEPDTNETAKRISLGGNIKTRLRRKKKDTPLNDTANLLTETGTEIDIVKASKSRKTRSKKNVPSSNSVDVARLNGDANILTEIDKVDVSQSRKTRRKRNVSQSASIDMLPGLNDNAKMLTEINEVDASKSRNTRRRKNVTPTDSSVDVVPGLNGNDNILPEINEVDASQSRNTRRKKNVSPRDSVDVVPGLNGNDNILTEINEVDASQSRKTRRKKNVLPPDSVDVVPSLNGNDNILPEINEADASQSRNTRRKKNVSPPENVDVVPGLNGNDNIFTEIKEVDASQSRKTRRKKNVLPPDSVDVVPGLNGNDNILTEIEEIDTSQSRKTRRKKNVLPPDSVDVVPGLNGNDNILTEIDEVDTSQSRKTRRKKNVAPSNGVDAITGLNGNAHIFTEIDEADASQSRKTKRRKNVTISKCVDVTSAESSKKRNKHVEVTETIEDHSSEQTATAGITPVRKSARKRETSRRLSTDEYIIVTKPKQSKKGPTSELRSTKKDEVLECRRSKRTRK